MYYVSIEAALKYVQKTRIWRENVLTISEQKQTSMFIVGIKIDPAQIPERQGLLIFHSIILLPVQYPFKKNIKKLFIFSLNLIHDHFFMFLVFLNF